MCCFYLTVFASSNFRYDNQLFFYLVIYTLIPMKFFYFIVNINGTISLQKKNTTTVFQFLKIATQTCYLKTNIKNFTPN